MVNYIEGNLTAGDEKFAIIVSRFNDFIASELLEGCLDSLKRRGSDEANIDVVRVPGAFEIPVTAQQLAATKKYAAVICLGAVIRGGTPHFDYVAGEAAKGVAQASMSTGVPVIFGIITADTIEQAIERAGSKAGNKGSDCAVAALEMINLLAQY